MLTIRNDSAEPQMPLIALTTAAALLVASPTATTTLSDAVRVAAKGGFLLGNAHRCGIASDRVVQAGSVVRQLFEAMARDGQDKDDATRHFAELFLAAAVADKGKSKLAASCEAVAVEFGKFERHRVAGGAPGTGTGSSAAPPRFRAGDGE